MLYSFESVLDTQNKMKFWIWRARLMKRSEAKNENVSKKRFQTGKNFFSGPFNVQLKSFEMFLWCFKRHRVCSLLGLVTRMNKIGARLMMVLWQLKFYVATLIWRNQMSIWVKCYWDSNWGPRSVRLEWAPDLTNGRLTFEPRNQRSWRPVKCYLNSGLTKYQHTFYQLKQASLERGGIFQVW